MRTLVIGDIHGQYRSLMGCLKASGFDYNNDRLIALGDVCDRGPQVKECIDELLKIKNLVYILGNHDAWTLNWVLKGEAPKEWLYQGGTETIDSYKGAGMAKEHIKFLSEAPLYFIEGRRVFLHGGFDPTLGVENTDRYTLLWDRSLAMEADRMNAISPEFRFGGHDEIYIGHTPTMLWKEKKPRQCCNVWMIDTASYYIGGCLTIMDVETKQYWQAT